MGTCRVYLAGDVPSDDDCWAGSYLWHLGPTSTRAEARRRRLPIMARLVEDGKLGASVNNDTVSKYISI